MYILYTMYIVRFFRNSEGHSHESQYIEETGQNVLKTETDHYHIVIKKKKQTETDHYHIVIKKKTIQKKIMFLRKI